MEQEFSVWKKRHIGLIQKVKIKTTGLNLNWKYQYEHWKPGESLAWNSVNTEKKPGSLEEMLIPGLGQKYMLTLEYFSHCKYWGGYQRQVGSHLSTRVTPDK